jgi:hypothetical protein
MRNVSQNQAPSNSGDVEADLQVGPNWRHR